MELCVFTEDRISDVIQFEQELRRQEPDTYFWQTDDSYRQNVEKSFTDELHRKAAVSLLAYDRGRVIGRIDAGYLFTHFDGTVCDAYLDWIAVLKEYRHRGVAQLLLQGLKQELKKNGVTSVIVLTAENPEAKKFYDSLESTAVYRGMRLPV